ncbi:unnamed protein product [Citrullus colocynthis]|uniref:Uncharacterized protein n=1 Tax=Citrullus colocynthis TaxID=252529 RepID=A0ABP0YIT7_9ROSI
MLFINVDLVVTLKSIIREFSVIFIVSGGFLTSLWIYCFEEFPMTTRPVQSSFSCQFLQHDFDFLKLHCHPTVYWRTKNPF